MLSDDSYKEVTNNIGKAESELLTITNKKIKLWNIISVARTIKKMLTSFFSLVIYNFKSVDEMKRTEKEVLRILKMQQRQLDLINRKIDALEDEDG